MMRGYARAIGLAAGLSILAACATARPPVAAAASEVDPGVLMSTAGPSGDYRIGVGDLVVVTVFQMPDLSAAARVDTSGAIQMPLIGQTQASGRTAPELAETVRARLAERYLQNPRVTASVTETASQKVTVDGAVTKPGVFEMKGRTTLMQAVAMAEGPTRTAQLERVAVFRTADGRREAAVFDLAAIRSGRAEDPQLQGDDVVIVDSSRLKAAWRDIIAALPGLAIFRSF